MRPNVRQKTIIVIMMVIFSIFLMRLFYIQVVDDTYKTQATKNAIRRTIVYPPRGIIYDRKGEYLVVNKIVFDIKVIPRQLPKDLDTLGLCDLLDITKEEFINRITKAKIYSPYLPSNLVSQMSVNDFAKLQERLYDFPGLYPESRTVRDYPMPIAGHVLGYIGEVNDRMIEKYGGYYQKGDYIGIAGIEKAYEDQLRGTKGVKYQFVDVHNRVQGSLKKGELDSPAVTGEDLHLTIDRKLQAYAETLMVNKRGSVVAIEPSSGEILAFVSSPTYNPNDLVGQKRAKTYAKLSVDPLKPLFNRPLMAKYPPGSIFKLGSAIIAQKDGVIGPQTHFICGSGFNIGNLRVNCNNGENHGVPDLNYAITESCNSYFCQVFKAYMTQSRYKRSTDAYAVWHDEVLKFGLGEKLGVDLPNEIKGLVPPNRYYDKRYGKNHWKWTNVISLSIGQGELGVTPIQMANYISIFANRGYYFTPHLIKYYGKNKLIPKRFVEKHQVAASIYFDNIMDAMQNVVEHGTAVSAKIPGITVLGKTGTSQNPHGKPHSIFVCFAPRENPKIAIAVYVENAGYGSLYAAPIASLMIEKYLTDTIKRPYVQQRLLQANLLNN
jgi:penicillin-binding protein 2